MKRLLDVLKPFKEATVNLSSKSETMPMLASLQHTLKLANNAAVDGGVRDLKSRLSDNIKATTEYLEMSDMHTIAKLRQAQA